MNLSKAIEVINGINESASLFQLFRSALSFLRSRWNGSQEKQLREEDVLQLESDLRCLTETVPATYNLIDRAEWRIHVPYVAQLVSELKDAVHDAEDLLDEFGWYKLKLGIEGQASQESQLRPVIDFFHNVIHGSFNKVIDIQKRLTNLSSQLERIGLHEAAPRFDKSLRPVTTSFRTEPKMFGREKELAELVRLLGVPTYSGSSRSFKRRRTTNAASNEPKIAFVPVLPIVGIGGVGKTTLSQEITTLQRVKSHFDNIIWICVSDDFDEERFTKVLIKSLSGKEATAVNLDDLQQYLVKLIAGKRFLLILDDIWPDVLKENGHRWRKFRAPFANALQGSIQLVTTRFAEVANLVGTMEPFPLEGLKEDAFWDFFKLCTFGSENYPFDDLELERIGRSILQKLKGVPLAARTIGRLLQKGLNPEHWNNILNNELWQLRQKETDILPALRLSYMYLPFYLKRCFSFCAVYPKDHNFEKARLAEIWVVEGFVEPDGTIPLQLTSEQYFEELVNLSFFQKLRGKFVMHDLMHDMAQLVSKDECFIVKNAGDIEKIPQNVRHLSLLKGSDVKCNDLFRLCSHTKLRTLLCNKSLQSRVSFEATSKWFMELWRLRVIHCTSIVKLPESIGNLKHLRYLEISRASDLYSLPSSFCSLYNLQILYARKCEFKNLPRGVSKLINLQKFEALHVPTMEVDVVEQGEKIRFINSFNLIIRDLIIDNLGEISSDHARELVLNKSKHLKTLTLRWGSSSQKHNQIEVLQALHPPTSIKSLYLMGYPGDYLPSWLSISELSAVTASNSFDRVGTIFSSLTDLSIEQCENLSNIELFTQPAYVPSIRKILVASCKDLKSLAIGQFQSWSSLEELKVHDCPKITYLLAPSIKTLTLKNSVNFIRDNVECIFLTTLHLSCYDLASTELQKWTLPVLRDLKISHCENLTSIRESEQIPTDLSLGSARSSTREFPLLNRLTIEWCDRLESLDDLLINTLESIEIEGCGSLSLPTEIFMSFPFLKDLTISYCPRVNWRSGMVLPSSVQKLTLCGCGNLSACFPRCLENLASLEYLEMASCKDIVSIPRHMWTSNLSSLQELRIRLFPDLESIGGLKAIEHIQVVHIQDCPKLKEVEQPLHICNTIIQSLC